MVHCTETEVSDSNEADRGSEPSDNDDCQHPATAAKNHVNKGMLSCSDIRDMCCHSQWNTGHRPLVSIHLCCMLPPPCFIPPVYISWDFFSVFGHLLSLWPWSGDCGVCLAMLSSFILSICPVQFHSPLLNSCSTGSWSVFLLTRCCLFLPASVYL